VLLFIAASRVPQLALPLVSCGCATLLAHTRQNALERIVLVAVIAQDVPAGENHDQVVFRNDQQMLPAKSVSEADDNAVEGPRGPELLRRRFREFSLYRLRSR